MKMRELLLIVFGVLLLMGAFVGCVAPSGSQAGSHATASVRQEDFQAIKDDINTLTMTAFDEKTKRESNTYVSRKGVLSAMTINGAEFDVLNPKGTAIEIGVRLVIQAAGDMDLSKAENVLVFEQKLRTLFAAHAETATVYVRMNGRILSLHGK